MPPGARAARLGVGSGSVLEVIIGVRDKSKVQLGEVQKRAGHRQLAPGAKVAPVVNSSVVHWSQGIMPFGLARLGCTQSLAS